LSISDNGLPPGDPANGPTGDSDGDGLSNLIEFLVGLDPLASDANGFPTLAIRRNPDGTVTLEFESIPDRLYEIFWSADLQSWTALGSVLSTGSDVFPASYQVDDAGPPVTPVHPGIVERRFYRMEISLP
jgi:hypothetical protein